MAKERVESCGLICIDSECDFTYSSSMKICSKCDRSLEESCFVKSDRYLDGLYPSCKECRKKIRDAYLAKNPICSKCEQFPHLPSTSYCSECLSGVNKRVKAGDVRVPKKNVRLCYRCRVEPREKRKRLCVKCNGICPRCLKEPIALSAVWCRACCNDAAKVVRERWKGKWLATRTPLQKRKLHARMAARKAVKAGVIKKEPCMVCGDPKSEGHHHKGYSKEHELDVQWFCRKHHPKEKWKKSLTT